MYVRTHTTQLNACAHAHTLDHFFLSTAFPKLTKKDDHPASLIATSAICLLQTLSVGAAYNCDSLSCQTLSSVASLYHHIVQCGIAEGKDIQQAIGNTHTIE